LHLVRTAAARLRELTRRSAVEAERDEEFRFHLEMEVELNRRRGLTDAEARRAALLAFGGVQRFREEASEARGIASLDKIARDTRFAVRRLWRSPTFSLGVVATLGVGVGAASAIGLLVYGVMLRPLPFPEPDRLVRVAFRTPGIDAGREHAHSHASFVHLRDAARAFSGFGAYHVNDAVNLTDPGDPQRVTAVMATPSVLTVLRVVPALGRPFAEHDAKETGTLPVLITHDLWRSRYGGDPGVVNGLIEINRRPRRVIGVLPAGFSFPVPASAVWFPLDVTVERAALDSRYLNVVARLRDGATLQEAGSELRAAIPRFPDRFPNISPADVERSDARAEVELLKDAIVAPVRQHMTFLGLTMLFVLLITVANVTNLFLLRAERLRHEIAITTALGAGSLALARRFVTEGIVLGAAAAVVAVPIVVAAVTSRFGFTSRDVPRLEEIALTPVWLVVVVLLLMLIATLVALVAFARGRRSRLSDAAQLRSTERTLTGGGWRRAQQVLVAMQVAVALALLLTASLMGRSLWNLRRVDLGFVPEQRATLEVTLPFRDYESYGQIAAFHANVLDRIRGIPGVAGAEAAREIPLIDENPEEPTLEFDAVGRETSQRASANVATPDYFRLMGIPVLHGRTFVSGDVRATMPAIVVSASLARALYGTTDVVGRAVRPPSPGSDDVLFRVVGVVGDVPRWRIEDGPASMAYFPLLRDADGVPPGGVRAPILMRSARYVLRSHLPVTQLAPAIRAGVRELDPRVPVTNFTSLEAMVDAATAGVRLTMLLLALASSAALLLGVIGVYSVVSYGVAGRRREFGVRLALGATPTRIQRTVLAEGARLAVIGAGGGLLAAAWGARIARSLLYGVSPTDPVLYATITAVSIAIAIGAALLPARRAGRLDPAEVMRGD
jgi:predicted permease